MNRLLRISKLEGHNCETPSGRDSVHSDDLLFFKITNKMSLAVVLYLRIGSFVLHKRFFSPRPQLVTPVLIDLCHLEK